MIEIGIDIGGTFTDVVCIQNHSTMHVVKSLSTRDVVTGVVTGVQDVLKVAGIDPGDAAIRITHVHGTTVATNAILEGTGAVTAFLCTAGHEDAIEIGRQKRSSMYDLMADAETPHHLCPKRLRHGVIERLDGQGAVVTPLDAASALAAVDRFVARDQVESIAVCLLNSYRNPVHEQQLKALILERHPHLSVSLSSEISPAFREYERSVVTLFDAYVRPIVERYLRQLASHLAAGEDASQLRVMQSRGGITSARLAARQPVSMLLSGPAGGVAGARFVTQASGFDDIVTFDTGGTSTDISLIRGGEMHITNEAKFKGYPIQFPMIDIHTIGSGGGSIAWLDDAGGLHVGPRSAGSTPGPACYGRGGEQPTVTDCSVVLGYINPATFAGGRVPLYPEKAHAVVGALAERLGMTPVELALGIHRIANAQMVEAIKLVTVRRGFDPRRAALVAFGGAGPIHAPAVARELGISRIVIPSVPGALSALGFLVSDIEFEGQRSFLSRLHGVDQAALASAFAILETAGRQVLAEEGIPGQEPVVTRYVDLRYVGQSYELNVALDGAIDDNGLFDLGVAFHAKHREIYGHASGDRAVEIVNIRTVHAQPLARKDTLLRAAEVVGDGSPYERRQCAFPGAGMGEVACYRREQLPRGLSVHGPALIEQADAALVVPPGWIAAVDATGNLIFKDTTVIDADVATLHVAEAIA